MRSSNVRRLSRRLGSLFGTHQNRRLDADSLVDCGAETVDRPATDPQIVSDQLVRLAGEDQLQNPPIAPEVLG